MILLTLSELSQLRCHCRKACCLPSRLFAGRPALLHLRIAPAPPARTALPPCSVGSSAEATTSKVQAMGPRRRQTANELSGRSKELCVRGARAFEELWAKTVCKKPGVTTANGCELGSDLYTFCQMQVLSREH